MLHEGDGGREVHALHVALQRAGFYPSGAVRACPAMPHSRPAGLPRNLAACARSSTSAACLVTATAKPACWRNHTAAELAHCSLCRRGRRAVVELWRRHAGGPEDLPGERVQRTAGLAMAWWLAGLGLARSRNAHDGCTHLPVQMSGLHDVNTSSSTTCLSLLSHLFTCLVRALHPTQMPHQPGLQRLSQERGGRCRLPTDVRA